MHKIIQFSIKNPKLTIFLSLFITFLFLVSLPMIQRDTDPINMLKQDNPVIVMYEKVKKDFNSSDIIGIGIEDINGNSLFTKDGLTKIYNITQEILQIEDVPILLNPVKKLYVKLGLLDDPNTNFSSKLFEKGDVVSISTSNDIVLNSNGELLVSPLLGQPPTSDTQAKEVLNLINSNRVIEGKLCSKKGEFVGIFIPIKDAKKTRAFFLGERIKEILKKHLGPNETFYYAGFPIAQATFAGQMFKQMGLFAPMAGVVIFLLLLMFFRSVKIVIAPLMIGVMTVLISMGALIYTGNVVHIISSMIPIFLLPIGVLNSIHILSKLSDRLHLYETKQEAINSVVSELFAPMLFTSLTTCVGFASLATTGIPPVGVFGIAIAFGVIVAWFLSLLIIPAYTMLLSDETLKKFSVAGQKRNFIVEMVQLFKSFGTAKPKLVLLLTLVVIITAAIGIPRIIVNDNSVRWFREGHFIRNADVVFNKYLAGAYLANLVFTVPNEVIETQAKESSDDEFDDFESVEKNVASVRDIKVIRYIDKVQRFLEGMKDPAGELYVGGTTSVIDVLKKIDNTINQTDLLPTTREQASQYIFLFENGDLKRGHDLWKLIDPDPNSKFTQIRVHFKTGDNQQMTTVMGMLDKFLKSNPPPQFTNEKGEGFPLKVEWSGLLKVNNVWQETMVEGMMYSLAGSFVIVFFMMSFLFRSFLWGTVSMLPLSVTISFLYGMIGHLGIFYNLPIAVLSSLSLGLSIDFAIHFIEHFRYFHKPGNSVFQTLDKVFDGTAQAIWRNVLVIAIGFIPLLFANLIPYVTVGSFFLIIMLVSGVTTLLIIPAIIALFNKKFAQG